MTRWLFFLAALLLWPASAEAQVNIDANLIHLGSAPCTLSTGSGAPSAGATCDHYLDTATGDFWVKASSGTWLKVVDYWTAHNLIIGEGAGTALAALAGCTNGLVRWASSSVDPICDTNPTVTSLTTTGGITLGTNELPTTGYSSNLGALSDKFLAVYGAELWIETLVAQSTMATIGGRILVAPTNELTVDRSPQLAAPGAPTVTPQGTAGTTTYKYRISALDADGETLASSEGQTTTGNAALSAGNNNLVTWSAVTGATSYNVYGRTSGAELFMSNTASLSFTDTGSITPAGALPTTNTTRNELSMKYNNLSAGDVTYMEANGKVEFFQVNDFPITGSSITNKQFTIAGNHTSEFQAGWTFQVAGSANNNGSYTVSTSSCAGNCWSTGSGTTTITMTAAPASNTADGYVLYVQNPAVTGYIYRMFRDGQDGSSGAGSQQWYAGDAMLDTGNVGNGFIDEYSIRGTKASTEQGPTIVGNVRNSTTYNDWSPRWAIGNLNGLYGYTAQTYGVAMGNPTATNIDIDATNGIRICNGTCFTSSNIKLAADTSGNLSLTGNLSVGTAGHIASGQTAFNTGTGYWLEYNSGTPRVSLGVAGGNRVVWDGTNLTVVSTPVTINQNGITVVPSNLTATNGYQFSVSGGGQAGLWVNDQAGLDRNTIVYTQTPSGQQATAALEVDYNGHTGPFQIGINDFDGTFANSTITLDANHADGGDSSTLGFKYTFAADHTVYVQNDIATRLVLGANSVNVAWDGAQFYPFNDNAKNLGTPSFRWGTTYTVGLVIYGTPQFAGTNSTGAQGPSFGANAPAGIATLTHPYTWIQVTTADGSTAYVPAWK